jgi:hypothetical protein
MSDLAALMPGTEFWGTVDSNSGALLALTYLVNLFFLCRLIALLCVINAFPLLQNSESTKPDDRSLCQLPA